MALTLWAPARWLASALHSATGGQLQLINARGTVWNGSAGVALSSGAGGSDALSLPGRLSWRLRPRADGLSGTLDLPCCASAPVGFAVRRAEGGVWLALQDSATRWPAAMLSGLGAPWNTLRLEGTLDLRTQGFSLHFQGRQLAIGGAATLDATDIASSLSTLRPLGSYRLALAGGAAPSLLLTTLAGPLQLAGNGAWNGVALRFSGEASAAPGSEDALANLLNIIGRRQGARSIITLG
ncbi:MAG: type II secretion system protein N [Comamonadaceae bacterium]|nr:MAG: type II secretion system protein N [Comamonadaceae bacterium]